MDYDQNDYEGILDEMMGITKEHDTESAEDVMRIFKERRKTRNMENTMTQTIDRPENGTEKPSEAILTTVEGETLETETKVLSGPASATNIKFFDPMPETLDFNFTKIGDDDLVWKASNFNYFYQINNQPAPSKLFTLSIQQKGHLDITMAMKNLSIRACQYIANVHSADKVSRQP